MSGNGSIRDQMAKVLLGAVLFALPGCNSAEQLPGSGAVVALRDSQYRIAVETRSPDSPDAVGQLLVHVEPQNGWKFALEAPAALHLDEIAGVEFEGVSEVTAHSKGHLEFTRSFRAEGAGDNLARGHIKFGICEGDESLCVLVRRDLDLPLSVAFTEPE